LHPKNKKLFPVLGKAQNEGLISFANELAKEINIRLLSMPYPRKSVSNAFSFFLCPPRPQCKILFFYYFSFTINHFLSIICIGNFLLILKLGGNCEN